MVHLGKGMRYLVPRELESKLLGARLYSKEHDGWSPAAIKEGILFDLSRVEWVDLESLVQILLLIEAALINGMFVKVAFPLPYPRKSEQSWLNKTTPRGKEECSRRIKRRENAKKYLEYLQFESALKSDHLKQYLNNIEISYSFDLSSAEDSDKEIEHDDTRIHSESDSKGDHVEALYKYIFPLTWMSADDDQRTQKLAKFLTGIVGESQRGLDAIDADTLSNVIFYELIENVKVHSQGTGWALIAAWAQPMQYYNSHRACLSHEQPYHTWLFESQSAAVQIIVGDSGKGIPKVLGEIYDEKVSHAQASSFDIISGNRAANILFWSLDRWSTSKEELFSRGTRGLYRVDRVVKKYHGLLTIRSEDQSIGWDHGGIAYDQPVHYPKKLSLMPGTILKLLMPAFREKPPLLRMLSKDRETISIQIVEATLLDSGLDDESRSKLNRVLYNAYSNQSVCVLCMIKSFPPHNQNKLVENFLKYAAEVRHPCTLIVYGLPGGWDLIENAIDSVNQVHEVEEKGNESKRREHFEIWDPVLVIGFLGQMAWVGASLQHRKILDELIKPKNKGALDYGKIAEILGDSKKVSTTLKSFRSDTNLITLNHDYVELRVSPAKIFASIFAHMRSSINDQIKYYIESHGEGVLTNGTYLTPSLTLTNKWLNVETVLKKTCGLDFAVSVLGSLLKQTDRWQQFGQADIIYADSAASAEVVRGLRDFLNIKDSETDSSDTVPLTSSESIIIIANYKRVIVHCDIIVSGETIKRCLKQVLRDEAPIIAITCLIDGRKEPTKTISVWNNELPIVSLLSLDFLSGISYDIKDHIAISPITLEPEASIASRTGSDYLQESLPSEKKLFALIKDNKALHFSHIGRPIGRHFTFYLDATQLIKEETIIEKFDLAISQWIQTSKESEHPFNFEIWYPTPEPKAPAPAQRFAEAIKSKRADAIYIRTIRRVSAFGRWMFTSSREIDLKSTNVVIIDWGAISGTTIMQMIRMAADVGANNILICIFANQLSNDEDLFFKQIRSLKAYRKISTEAVGQLKLSYLDPAMFKEEEVSVKVEFLEKLAIRSYENSINCPVCQRCDQFKIEYYPSALLKNYAKEQESLLRPRSRASILSETPKDFEGQELDSEGLIWMLFFREKLENALTSTGWRKNIYDKIEHLNQQLQAMPDDPPKKVLWLLYLLSIEVQWIQSSPLKLQKTTIIVAQMCVLVINNKRIKPKDKKNALIVLRIISPRLFAENIYSFFNAVYNYEPLMKQLLYDIYTFHGHHPRQILKNPDTLESMYKGLKKVSSEIINKNKGILSKETFDTYEILLYRIEHAYHDALAKPFLPIDAWKELKTLYQNYLTKHGLIYESLTWLMPGHDYNKIELAIKEYEATKKSNLDAAVTSWAKSLRINWSPCLRFLEKSMFPYLKRLRKVLNSHEAEIHFSKPVINKLTEILDDVPLAEQKITRLIWTISEDPMVILNRKEWEYFKETIDWYAEHILKRQDTHQIGSTLLELLAQAPSDLGEVFNLVYNDMNETGLLISHDISGKNELKNNNYKVFCTKDLLRDVVKELLRNCSKHHDQNSEGKMSIIVSAEVEEDQIIFIMKNNKTKPSPDPGVGLETLRDRLSAFDAELLPNNRPEDAIYSFQVTLKFTSGE